MKKIYMILAAMTLLSMSLNAQRLPANFVGGINFTPTGKAYLHTPTGQFRMPTLNADEYLFGPYTTDDFDATGVGFAGYYNQAQDITSVVMMTKAEYESHLGDTIIGFRFALAGSSNVRVYDFGLYPTSNSWFATNQYKIWELGAIGHGGSSSGGGSSTPVPASQTVATGTTTHSYIPVCGSYQDYGYRTQMIYPASLLNMSNGDQITSITLYPSSGIKFSGSSIVFQLCNTTEANFGTSSNSNASRKTVSGAVTATINNPSVNNSLTEWTITFDSPLTYTGGNLLLDVYCQGYTHDGITGSWTQTPFLGANQTNYQSMYVTGSSSATPSISGTGYNAQFLPQTTFNYTTTSGGGSSSTGTIDVGNGATTSGYLPAYGYMQDVGYRNQMIYTANQISLSSGSQITSITFYPENGTGIPFYGSTVTLSLGNTTTSYFSGSKITPSDLTAVASKRITATDVNATAWTFTFDTPFTYTGGNLLVQVYCPGYNNDGTSGQWSRGYFYGDNQSNNVSIYSSGSSASGTSGTNSTFLPKATFGYNGSIAIPEYLELAGGQWHDFYLDEPVVFEFSGDTIQNVMMGYTFYQEYDTNFKPVAVNSNSTGHSHYDFMYARSSSSSSYSRGWWGDGVSGSANADRPGDMAVQLIFKEAKQKTPAPTITYTQDAGYYYVTATATDANATVTLTVDGQTYTGTGSVTIPVGRGNTDRTVTATATAQEPGKLVSDPTNATITILASVLEPTPAPTIGSQVLDASVQVTGSGQGDVHMYVDGVEVTSPYYAERGTEDYYITVIVTAQIQDGDHSMSTTTQQVLVPAINFNPQAGDWIELPGTYNNDQVINWNQYLMFVDRFTVSTADNKQPKEYVYVMTEDTTKLIRPCRTTNDHTIPVQLTRSKVWGYYTKGDVDTTDKARVLDLDLINAEVEMNLEQSSEIYYYTLDRSRNSILDENFIALSDLQNDGARYVEFSKYYLPVHAPFNFGKMTRFDSIDVVLPPSAPQGVDGKHYGTYTRGDYMAYVPIIWTHGNDPANTRLNFDNDSLNNSYGSPIWKSSVGYLDVKNTPSGIVRQNGRYAVKWTDENGHDCSLFRARVEADGYLPNPTVTNVKYEPYMFRIWVECDSLREYRAVTDANNHTTYENVVEYVNGQPVHKTLKWLKDVPCDSATMSYEGNVWKLVYGDITDHASSENYDYSNDLIFGATNGAEPRLVVRFYYRSTGLNNKAVQPQTFMLNRDGAETPSYYAVEGGFDPDSIPVAVYELVIGNGVPVSTTYYNLQGMESSTPFEGINIIVTRYSDGTVRTRKEMRK